MARRRSRLTLHVRWYAPSTVWCPRSIAIAGSALLLACQTTPGPDATATAYAAALREGRMDDAWALTSGEAASGGLSRAAFEQRYADAATRRRRADVVEAAVPELTASAGALTLVSAEGGWRVVESDPRRAARQALGAFVTATEAGDFAKAYALLAGPLRARYTPERLAADFDAEPLARERLARARAALENEPVFEDEEAHFAIGDGKVVRLRLEEGEYRVLTLE